MRKFLVIFSIPVILILELIFIGFPYRYHHQYYETVGKGPTVDGLEIILMVVESASSYTLGAPTKTGAPYRISLDIYGDKEKHVSLVINSLSVKDSSRNEYFIVVPDRPLKNDFIARQLWRAFAYPVTTFTPRFSANSSITVYLGFTIMTKAGAKNYKVVKEYIGKESSGIGLFPLMAVLYA